MNRHQALQRTRERTPERTLVLERALRDGPAESLLDVGCGDGALARWIDSLGICRSIIGIDPDKESIDDARRLTDSRRVSYRIRSTDDLGFPTLRFDVALMSYVLHHMDDPVTGVRRVADVLHPDGRLIVREPIADGLSAAQIAARDLHHLKATIDRLLGITHNDTFESDEIRRLIASAGYRIASQTVACGPAGDDSADRAIEFARSYGGVGLSATVDRMRERVVNAIRRDGIEDPPEVLLVATPGSLAERSDDPVERDGHERGDQNQRW